MRLGCGWITTMKTKIHRLFQRAPQLALTRREVAESLGLSVETIARLTKQGLLNPIRVVRRPIYAVSEIQRFLTENTRSDLLK